MAHLIKEALRNITSVEAVIEGEIEKTEKSTPLIPRRRGTH